MCPDILFLVRRVPKNVRRASLADDLHLLGRCPSKNILICKCFVLTAGRGTTNERLKVNGPFGEIRDFHRGRLARSVRTSPKYNSPVMSPLEAADGKHICFQLVLSNVGSWRHFGIAPFFWPNGEGKKVHLIKRSFVHSAPFISEVRPKPKCIPREQRVLLMRDINFQIPQQNVSP